MLLEAKNLRVYYGRVEALKGISFEVAEGTIVALIGANGAGKSTTLKAISGLVKLASGEIWFQDRRIDKMPPYKIVRLGVSHILEGKRLYSAMSVIENLEMGAYIVKGRKKVAKALEVVYGHFPILKEKRGQLAGSLSGGEQQMLATARGLMPSPKLLLMDEPSLGLSPVLVQEVADIIRAINQEGVSIILVEQNARLALRLAHAAIVLEIGNIALKGDAKEVASDERMKKAYLGG